MFFLIFAKYWDYILLCPKKQKAFAFFCGLLAALSFAPLYYFIFLIPAFASILLLISPLAPKKSFWIGWWFGFGYFTAGLYWIAVALSVDIKQFAWLLPFTIFGLPALLAFYTGLAFGLTSYFKLKGFSKILLFSMLWTITEWVRGHVLTGFPWSLIGYCWLNYLPLAQIISIIGIYGLSFLTVLVSSVFSLWPSKKLISCCVSLFIFLGLWGQWRLNKNTYQEVPNVTLRLVQPSISQKLKWSADYQQKNLETLLKFTNGTSSSSQITAYIWPESATAFFLANSPGKRQQIIRSLKHKSYLMTGSIRGLKSPTQPFQIWNSLIVIDPQSDVIAFYDKSHLVPFGEYIPFHQWLPDFIQKITPGSVDFTQGRGPKTLHFDSLPPFSPLICYEVIFPGAVTSSSEQRPEWLLNITNDAWYGQTSGPYQHFDIARARAIEEGLPLVRVANNGISGVISPYGQIIEKMDLNVQGFIDAKLPCALKNQTLYSKFKDLTLLTLFILLSIYLFINHKRKYS